MQYQGSLTSSDTGPYGEGHRYAYYVVNGNQTGGAGSGDYAEFQYKAEAQDMATCGWNYTSASSFITLSFWVKSNVAQNFYGFVYSADGTSQRYIFETGTLSANTWTKVVKTIPGGTNVQFDHGVHEGFIIKWIPFYGTDKTNNSATVGSWANYNGAARCPDYTSTWWTTDNSTFWITGVQLEVGPQATPFEHRSYQEEIELCYRYYYKVQPNISAYYGSGFWYSSTTFICHIDFPVVMRTNVTSLETSGTASHYKVIANSTTYTCNSAPSYLGDANNTSQSVNFPFSSGPSQGQGGLGRSGSSSGYLAWDAEL